MFFDVFLVHLETYVLGCLAMDVYDYCYHHNEFCKRSKTVLAKLGDVFWCICGNMAYGFALASMLDALLGPNFSEEKDLKQVVAKLVFAIGLEEVLFYWVHMALHAYFYETVHKIHHEFVTPISWIALYAHPFEHLLCNLMPPLFSMWFLGMSPGLAKFWAFVATLSAVIAHGLPDGPHDYHHKKLNYNFGVTGILDHLLATGYPER